jgi:hypothetical protein
MTDIVIEIEGLAELEKKLGRIGAIRELRPAMAEANEKILGDTDRYPPKRPGRKMKWKSRKQQIFVIMSIREGSIHVPYDRKHTGGLAGSWVSKVSVIGQTLTGTVGSNENKAPYARYVVGPNSQAEFHKEGGWWTTATLLKRRKGDIEDIFASRIREVLRK